MPRLTEKIKSDRWNVYLVGHFYAFDWDCDGCCDEDQVKQEAEEFFGVGTFKECCPKRPSRNFANEQRIYDEHY